MRIDKFLSLKGICTRSKVKKFLKMNQIYINEISVENSAHKIEYNDIIYINQIMYTYNKNVYFLLNKPNGYVSATKDDLHLTVIDLINDIDFQTDLFPVGRLDIDTTGILLITNDGKFSYDLLSPKKHINKVYEVEIKDRITRDMIKALEKGVIINEDYLTKPAQVEVVSETKIFLTIKEGKYHQVKEMLKAINNEVVSLKRVKFGKYNLPEDLEIGDYIKL